MHTSRAGQSEAADLEKTAELPALGPRERGCAPASQDLSSTDTWILPQPAEPGTAPSLASAGPAPEPEPGSEQMLSAQLDQARRERGEALRRAAELEREGDAARRALDAARSQLAKLEQRARQLATTSAPLATLERQVAERDRALRAAHQRIEEFERELSAHREALSTVEGRRNVFESLLHGLQNELSDRDTRLAQLEAAVGAPSTSTPHGGLTRSFAERALRGCLRGRARPSIQLVRLDTPDAEVHVLGSKARVGRTPDNDVRLGAPFVSRQHARIVTDGEQCFIEDLNSTNGVRVNGRRVARQGLKNGDQIELGDACLRFVTRRIV